MYWCVFVCVFGESTNRYDRRSQDSLCDRLSNLFVKNELIETICHIRIILKICTADCRYGGAESRDDF